MIIIIKHALLLLSRYCVVLNNEFVLKAASIITSSFLVFFVEWLNISCYCIGCHNNETNDRIIRRILSVCPCLHLQLQVLAKPQRGCGRIWNGPIVTQDTGRGHRAASQLGSRQSAWWRLGNGPSPDYFLSYPVNRDKF